jgi:hypothetical protein
MEFDILNEIMTCTVAQLFTDLSKHANYMKTSSQMGQDKSEIPKQFDYFPNVLGSSAGSSLDSFKGATAAGPDGEDRLGSGPSSGGGSA